MHEKSFLKTLEVLAQRAAPENRLEVMHSSHVWTASFEWQAAATEDEILYLEQTLGQRLPTDYREFLRMHNGVVLYKDLKYGQWGFQLYGTHELAVENREWAENLSGKWRAQFIAFAENLGDANVLVFDTSQPTPDGASYAVLEGNAFDNPQEWVCASRSFHEWLEHLVTAQGDKYWEWH